MRIKSEMSRGEEKEEKTQNESAREVVEQTLIHQEFGEEINCDTYVAGVSRDLEVQVGDLADFSLEELGKIQEKALKISDAGFLRRMEKIFAVNAILINGMKKDMEGTNAAETAKEDGEEVRFFRQEYIDDKGRIRYLYNARPQKVINEMVEGMMGGRIPQMHGQPPPTSVKPPLTPVKPPVRGKEEVIAGYL